MVKQIKIQEETKNRLDALKVHPRQSYDEVIKELMKKEVEKNDRPNEEGIRD